MSKLLIAAICTVTCTALAPPVMAQSANPAADTTPAGIKGAGTPGAGLGGGGQAAQAQASRAPYPLQDRSL